MSYANPLLVQPALTITFPRTQQAWDSTPQFAYGGQFGTSEYWQGMGGNLGVGGTLFANNGTINANVDGNLVMSGTGGLFIGNAYGYMLKVQRYNTDVLAGFFSILPSSDGSVIGLVADATSHFDGSKNNTGIAVAPLGTGAFTLDIPDSTAAGGNARGTNAVDLQMVRSAATQVVSGSQSFMAGGGSQVAGNGSGAVGLNHVGSGNRSFLTGDSTADLGVYGLRAHASGKITTVGDTQTNLLVMRTTTSGAALVVLTSDGLAGSNINRLILANNTSYAWNLTLKAYDSTTPANYYIYFAQGLAHRDATSPTTSLTVTVLGTPVTGNGGTGSTAAATVTASTGTSGAVNINFTPPSANTDTWSAIAEFSWL